ncbi:MAG: ribosome silencing factor [Syntrophobacterales bacterium]|nr:ribosome silencing factor [Syntrophobacterales bacterium]
MAAGTLTAHKAVAPVILDVRRICAFADYFVIAAGTSRRHVQALAQHLEEALGAAGIEPLGREGVEEGNWILLDYNEVIIHLFLPPFREFYDLEGLWAEAPRMTAEEYLAGASPAPGGPA